MNQSSGDVKGLPFENEYLNNRTFFFVCITDALNVEHQFIKNKHPCLSKKLCFVFRIVKMKVIIKIWTSPLYSKLSS